MDGQLPSMFAAGQPADRQQALPAARRPSLLPAFEEPFSSSPGLPRPAKRKFDEALEDRKYYPTPVPTSSTGILPSSSPARFTRPALQRSVSILSERAPLGDVPTLSLPVNGEPVLMGRSSNSSDYQLPGNRQISRIHVRAQYCVPHAAFPNGKIEVECLGWNGAKVHCREEVVELAKGEVFESDKRMSQIVVDVQSTRVMLMWPKLDARDPLSRDSRSPWAVESPGRRASAQNLASSPPIMLPPRAPASPISPTPNVNFGATFASTFHADDDDGAIQVYEDHNSDEDAPHDPVETPRGSGTPTPKQASIADFNQFHASIASEPEEFSEHDEENDPIVRSFYEEGIMSGFNSLKSTSPERKRKPLKAAYNSPGRTAAISDADASPIKNHVINQLAFSRIHSLPLSTIHSALPLELRGAMVKPSDTENREVLTTSELKSILDNIPCVGEISREGKDAAGKLLESEFYYVPEMDANLDRRETVTQSLGKTGLRAARKQHKQYYWKRPRN